MNKQISMFQNGDVCSKGIAFLAQLDRIKNWSIFSLSGFKSFQGTLDGIQLPQPSHNTTFIWVVTLERLMLLHVSVITMLDLCDCGIEVLPEWSWNLSSLQNYNCTGKKSLGIRV